MKLSHSPLNYEIELSVDGVTLLTRIARRSEVTSPLAAILEDAKAVAVKTGQKAKLSLPQTTYELLLNMIYHRIGEDVQTRPDKDAWLLCQLLTGQDGASRALPLATTFDPGVVQPL